jgi:hypothetical protein
MTIAKRPLHIQCSYPGRPLIKIIRVRFISVETVPKVGENDQILSTKPSGRSFVQLI